MASPAAVMAPRAKVALICGDRANESATPGFAATGRLPPSARFRIDRNHPMTTSAVSAASQLDERRLWFGRGGAVTSRLRGPPIRRAALLWSRGRVRGFGGEHVREWPFRAGRLRRGWGAARAALGA